MDNMESSSNNEAEIDDLVQALHTWYEFAKMPSMMVGKRHPNGDILKVQRNMAKSTSKSIQLKHVADRFFRYGKYENASLSYTQCLKYAETNSGEEAHAYANRSEALFELGKYKECQLDIERALRSNYPKDKWDTLVGRYKRCKSLRDAANSASSDQAKNDQDVGFVDEDNDVDWGKLCEELTNPLLPKTSKKIRLECNETWGRHMIASEDIKAGEILSCEKYRFLWVANQDKGSRCTYCNTTCCALIPCESCSMDMYCSMYCRIRAWNLYHRIECQIYRRSSNELDGVLMDIDFVILRMLLISTDQGAGLETLMKKLPMRDIFAEKIDPTTTNKPFISDYLASLRLRRTFPKPLLDFNSKPGVVVRMILALQNAGYFGHYSDQQTNTSSEKRLSDKELYTALLLVNHRISVPTSTFKMNTNHETIIENKGPVSVGIPILHNMVNYSCNPNSFYTTRYHENLLFASRPISKDEQIFITHNNSDYTIYPLRMRQDMLANPFRSLGFTCKCEACIGHWPVHSVDSEQFLGANLKKEVKKFNEMIELALETGIERMNRNEILHLISRVIEWLSNNLARPSPAIMKSSLLLKAYANFFYASEERILDYSSTLKKFSRQFSAIKVAVSRLQTSRGLNQSEGDSIKSPRIRIIGRHSRSRR